MALLITFLINGGFSYAVETRAELRDKIVQEQDNVSQMLKDADKSISNIELKIKKLTQRGEFWVKPLERSYQVAFITSFGNYTKNRNRTDQNFTEPEYNVPATNGQSGNSGNRYVVDINGITVLANNKATTGNSSSYRGNYNYNGRNLGEYGIVKNPLEFVDKIDFGASITPKAVTEKTVVVKTVSETKVTEPKVSVSKIDVSRVTVTPPAAPVISAPANPGNPSVNVTAPGAITPLGTITVAAIPAINVSVAAPTVGAAPTVNAPTVQNPPTPGGFSPAKIPLPAAPNDPAKPGVTLFEPAKLNFVATGYGQPSNTAFYINGGNAIANNFKDYDTNSTTFKINVASGVPSWTGTLVGTDDSNVSSTITSPHSASGKIYSFFNETQGRDLVTHRGTYEMSRDDGFAYNPTVMFLSLNPYSHGTTGTRTYDFQGTVNLIGHDNPANSNVLVGFEHQLLGAYNGISVLKNSGIINLKSGNRYNN